MRNPWVHEEVPDNRSIYESRAKLLGTALWGVSLLVVGLFVTLSGSGGMDLGGTGTGSTLLTALVAALALVLVFPVLLKLLAVSRLLASVAFLGAAWTVGRFVMEREADRIGEIAELAAARELLHGASEAVGELSELLDVVSVLV